MTERSHEEFRSLVAPYVLGAVPAEEIAEIRRHIVMCETCLADAEQYAAAAASLAALVEPEELPEGFADRVIAEIGGGTTQAPARTPGRASGRAWPRLVFAGLSALLLAAVATLGALLLDTRRELDQSRSLALAVLDASEGVELTGTEGVDAKLLTGGDEAIFVASGLEAAPDGRTYQLWFLEDAGPVSAGTFNVTDGIAILRMPRGFTGNGAAVTIEPRGGSAQPTTEPILASA